jgi:regulator of protease activity HflC (stomatin/prohibitin superfamily)
MVTEAVEDLGVLLVLVFAIVLILLAKSVQTVPPYAVGVVTMFGSFRRQLNPGFSVVSPLARVLRVDLRPQTRELRERTVTLSDGTSVTTRPRLTFRVKKAPAAVFGSADYAADTVAAAERLLEPSIGRRTRLELLSSRESVTAAVLESVNSEAAKWGVEATELVLNLALAPGSPPLTTS